MLNAARFAREWRQISARFTMTMTYCWFEAYQAALFETSWTKIQERVQAAESEIHERRRVLSEDHGGTPGRKARPHRCNEWSDGFAKRRSFVAGSAEAAKSCGVAQHLTRLWKSTMFACSLETLAKY